MNRTSLIRVALLSAGLLSGCSVTDQFTPRIYSNNVSSQTALDQETLLNIIRSSRYQPLNFLAITKTNGGQNGSLTLGLPNLTLGPGQTLMQRQFEFANNSVSGQLESSFEANPLISSAFQRGMLSPVGPKTTALLLGAYPRETVFLALLDGVKMTSTNSAWYFKNDPSNNSYGGQADSPSCRQLEKVSASGAVHTAVAKEMSTDYNRECNFSQFIYYLHYGLAYGMTAELEPGSDSAARTRPTEEATARSDRGRLCFDASLAEPDFRTDALRSGNQCGVGSVDRDVRKFRFGDGYYTIELRFRSPLGVYAYLGKLLRDGTADKVLVRDETDRSPPEKLIDIDDATIDCLLSSGVIGGQVCRPSATTRNTLIMISILEQLRNLMIDPSDLNSSFAVLVSD